MAPIDSMLRLFIDHGADELLLAANALPRMFQRGRQMKLALPLTPDAMLRHLLGDLLTAERDELVRSRGATEFDYAPQGSASGFHVVLKRGAEGLEAAFRVAARRPEAAAPPIVQPAAVPASAPGAPRAIGVASAPPPSPPPAAAGSSTEIEEPGSPRVPPHSPLGSLLAAAAAARASDLHLADNAIPFLRVDGALQPIGRTPIDQVLDLIEGIPSLAAREIAAGRRAFDGTLDFGDRRVRLHVYRTADGVVAALRVLPGLAPTLAALDLPVDLSDVALLPGGLVLVCGPTGSGKSATLAALAQEAVRRRGALLVTLEDPVEYRVQPGSAGLVRQRQVGRDVPDFPTGLREALREDPDVLLIGEMRDAESVALALTAAETGHLVLASLHSRTAAAAIERIADATSGRRDAEVRAQVAQSLRVIISQRLLPRARGAGRVAALEVLRVNHAVAALLRDGKTPQIATALQSSRKEGMLPLDACLADLVRAGTVTREAAAAAANDTGALADYLAGR